MVEASLETPIFREKILMYTVLNKASKFVGTDSV